MLCVCVGDVMDVVFSVCIVSRLVLHIIVHLHISFYYVHCSFLLFLHITCPQPSSPHHDIAFTLKKHMDLCLFCPTHTEIIIIFPFL